MKLDPNEFYLFTFEDAARKHVAGGYEQPRAAFAFAKARQLTSFVMSYGRAIRVSDQSTS